MFRCFGILFLTASSFADWPQFQGPHRNGQAPEADLARTWPAEGPPTLWSLPVGEGFGGPAVRDGQVFVLDRVDDQYDVMRCIDLANGNELWRYGYEAPGRVSYNGSRSTPAVSATHVYSVGMTGQLFCIDRATALPVWNVNLAREYPARDDLNWGYSQSPVLYENLVIVAPQSTKGCVAAFDRATGDLVWASESLGSPGYVSPSIVTLAGVDQVVMVSAGRNSVHGISLADGSVLWRYNNWDCRIPIPHPTALPGDRLFITGEYGAGSAMIRLEKSGDTFRAIELYKTQDCGSQIHVPLFYDGYLYMNSNGNRRNDGMLCLSLDGEVQWRTRDDRSLPQFERGGLLLAGDLIVNFDGKEGTLHLIDPAPEAYREIARAKIFEGQQMWGPMALAGGRLVLRSQSELKCLDLRTSNQSNLEFLLPQGSS